jgi:hypothetical protein
MTTFLLIMNALLVVCFFIEHKHRVFWQSLAEERREAIEEMYPLEKNRRGISPR